MPRYFRSINYDENLHFILFYVACDCHPYGIVDKQCDTTTGMCQCKPNIIGKRCDQCQVIQNKFENLVLNKLLYVGKPLWSE